MSYFYPNFFQNFISIADKFSIYLIFLFIGDHRDFLNTGRENLVCSAPGDSTGLASRNHAA
jgi:hypothetical protein